MTPDSHDYNALREVYRAFAGDNLWLFLGRARGKEGPKPADWVGEQGALPELDEGRLYDSIRRYWEVEDDLELDDSAFFGELNARLVKGVSGVLEDFGYGNVGEVLDSGDPDRESVGMLDRIASSYSVLTQDAAIEVLEAACTDLSMVQPYQGEEWSELLPYVSEQLENEGLLEVEGLSPTDFGESVYENLVAPDLAWARQKRREYED